MSDQFAQRAERAAQPYRAEANAWNLHSRRCSVSGPRMPTEFIDSTGIALVLKLADKARTHDTNLVIVRGPEPVHRVFALSGIDPALTFINEAGR